MTILIHTIKANKKASRNKKRVGRGNSSGHGTYSCRGLKGQKSRSGVSGLKRLGMKQILLRTPKKKGFKSEKIKDQIVNLEELNKHFKSNEVVTPKSLQDKGLIDNINIGVKILANGKLKVKNLKFQNVKYSRSVKAQIEKPKKDKKEDKK
ncbi:50S ribosomal protein L15 [Patescibacteria group bacterium]